MVDAGRRLTPMTPRWLPRRRAVAAPRAAEDSEERLLAEALVPAADLAAAGHALVEVSGAARVRVAADPATAARRASGAPALIAEVARVAVCAVEGPAPAAAP